MTKLQNLKLGKNSAVAMMQRVFMTISLFLPTLSIKMPLIETAPTTGTFCRPLTGANRLNHPTQSISSDPGENCRQDALQPQWWRPFTGGSGLRSNPGVSANELPALWHIFDYILSACAGIAHYNHISYLSIGFNRYHIYISIYFTLSYMIHWAVSNLV